jgi:hypothetical protein
MKTPLHPEPLSLVIPAPASWQAYLSALQRAEKYWVSSGRLISRGRVFDTRYAISWQKTISLGHALIQKGNWLNLSQRDIAILFGYNHGATDYGLLADTGRAAIAREAFYNNYYGVRQVFENDLGDLLNITGAQVVQAAANWIAKLAQPHFFGFGTTIATRLLALARPDCCVSVTDTCARNLAILAGLDGVQLSGVRDTLGNSKNYPKLLNWLHTQLWYTSPAPNDLTEYEVWWMRAALIDAFVYNPPPRATAA